MADNTETLEETAEVAEEIAEEIADAIDEENVPETAVDVTVVEAPEPEEPEAKFAAVDVGDLHISGPAEMVEKITGQYLKDHLDHNPHGESHTPGDNGDGNFLDESVSAITPDIVEEQVRESVSDEIVDNPPEPEDWLFRNRR